MLKISGYATLRPEGPAPNGLFKDVMVNIIMPKDEANSIAWPDLPDVIKLVCTGLGGEFLLLGAVYHGRRFSAEAEGKHTVILWCREIITQERLAQRAKWWGGLKMWVR